MKKNEVKTMRYRNSDHTKCREIVYNSGAAKRMRRSVAIDRAVENIVLIGMVAVFVGLYILAYRLMWG